jgi:hypothetical protein
VGWSPSNGSSVSMRLTLPAAYSQGRIPSKSFGIHVGSVYHNISGSLMLGGYDRSRCITNPIVSDSATFQLVDISLGVAAGISSFIDLPQGNRKGLLRANGSALSELSVRPNPAVPYIYLPRDTCDAIASHLPVTYSSDFNLYLWDAEHPAYEQIIRSPHYLSFSFATGSGLTSSIDVPFALLNLTLDWPLTEIPTPYFPCSPWLATNDPHNFGRAFLQAAFLARDWQQGGDYILPRLQGQTTLHPMSAQLQAVETPVCSRSKMLQTGSRPGPAYSKPSQSVATTDQALRVRHPARVTRVLQQRP